MAELAVWEKVRGEWNRRRPTLFMNLEKCAASGRGNPLPPINSLRLRPRYQRAPLLPQERLERFEQCSGPKLLNDCNVLNGWNYWNTV